MDLVDGVTLNGLALDRDEVVDGTRWSLVGITADVELVPCVFSGETESSSPSRVAGWDARYYRRSNSHVRWPRYRQEWDKAGEGVPPGGYGAWDRRANRVSVRKGKEVK